MTANATTVYRTFDAYADTENGVFTITEKGTRTDHPMNWLCGSGTTDRDAWAMARSGALPVVITMLDGTVKNVGVVFDAATFERAAYDGYVSYGYSMTDGYYAPIKFDAWVKDFRRGLGREILSQNDSPKYVKDALPLYQASL